MPFEHDAASEQKHYLHADRDAEIVVGHAVAVMHHVATTQAERGVMRPLSMSDLSNSWDELQEKYGRYPCYAIFVLLPSDREAIRYLASFGREIDLISGTNALVVVLSDVGIAFSSTAGGATEIHGIEGLASQMQARSRRSQLHQVLARRFNDGELRTLYFELGIDYDDLSGGGKADKVRELIAYLERRHRTHELLSVGRRLRPDIPWNEIPEAIEEGDSLWSIAVEDHASHKDIVMVARMFGIGFDKFPGLLVFEDISSPQFALVSLRGMTTEQIAQKMRIVFTLIQEAVIQHRSPLQAVREHVGSILSAMDSLKGAFRKMSRLARNVEKGQGKLSDADWSDPDWRYYHSVGA